jgi:hypothetical protein
MIITTPDPNPNVGLLLASNQNRSCFGDQRISQSHVMLAAGTLFIETLLLLLLLLLLLRGQPQTST